MPSKPISELTEKEIEERREYFREYYARNAVKMREYHRNYYHSNPKKHWNWDGKYAERRKAMRKRKNLMIADYKSEAGCVECGEIRPVALDLHHVDPKTKREDMVDKGKNAKRRQWNDLSYQDIWKEIEKCIVLCANCHRVHHHS